MPRKARLDAPGTLHHVIIRGIEKGEIVKDREDRNNFLTRLGKVATESKTAIYAWSLMSNHAHIFLRSGAEGISSFMRRLLTGYAIAYNRRHRRYGHLFQNRYKSIICDEDSYFRELVRYIHLNPLRAKLVKDMGELDKCPWCGHSVVMGRVNYGWQDRDYVLSWFGKKQGEAKRKYRNFVIEGIKEGRRSDLVGGGLVRSLGGWSAVKTLRIMRKGEVLSDDRILGSGEFVEKIFNEAEENIRYQIRAEGLRKKIEAVIKELCAKEKVNVEELQMGGRRGHISEVRLKVAKRLVEGYGVPLAEVARHLGVTTPAISNALRRAEKNKLT